MKLRAIIPAFIGLLIVGTIVFIASKYMFGFDPGLGEDQWHRLIDVTETTLKSGEKVDAEGLEKRLQFNREETTLIAVSVSDGLRKALVGKGDSLNFVMALDIAIKKLQESLPEGFKYKWVKIDIARRGRKIDELTSESYFKSGSEYKKLFRWHRTFENPSESDLKRSLDLAASYLVMATKQDGRFVYSYNPVKVRESGSYNILRHAGTIYSMIEYYEFSENKAVLAAVRRAFRYLIANIKPCPAPHENMKCVVEGGATKLGGNALAVVALSKYTMVTGERRYRRIIAQLCKRIVALQLPTGEFKPHKEKWPSGVDSDFVFGYYPGEAILGLLRAYEVSGDVRLLESADLAARWLIDVRDKGKSIMTISHDHWFLYALAELYQQNKRLKYVTHSKLIVDAIVRKQRVSSDKLDWVGSYYDPPRSTPTATRTEGLMAAYSLFQITDDKKYQAKTLSAAALGIEFQLGTQIYPERAMYLAEPKRVIGGFAKGLKDYEVRIDYVQHNISAILAYLNK